MVDYQQDVETSRRMDIDFQKEDYRFRARIISSEYAQRCMDLINALDVSQSCKITLAEIVSVNFDSNAVLSRTDNLNIRKLQLQVALNVAHTAYDASDTQNPGLLNVQQAITDAFGDFISRSFMGKERDQIGRSETISHQSYSGLPAQPGQQEPQRGFSLPWSRRPGQP